MFLYSLLILSVLNVNMTGVSAFEFPASPTIMVIPERIVDSDLTPGENFTVAIHTDYNGTDIWGYEFTLNFDPSVLHGINVTNGDLIVGLYSQFLPGKGFDNVEGTLSLVGGYFYYTPPSRPRTARGPGALACGPCQIT